MDAKSILFVPVVFAFLFAPYALASYATVTSYAAYGSVFEDTSADSSITLADPAQADAFAGFGLDDYALSEAGGYLDGRVYGLAEGLSTAGSPLYASTTAFSSANWLIGSDTLADGTPVQVRLEVTFEGLFYSENSHASSSAQAWVKLDGAEVYAGSASFAKPVLAKEGVWTYSLSPLGSNSYDLYAPGLLLFNTAVGETINLTLFLRTEIEWTDPSAGYAKTEITGYYNSQSAGTYNPSTGKVIDANLILIPEPWTFVLLAAGGALLGSRKYTADVDELFES
jgi:hypothetical protein